MAENERAYIDGRLVMDRKQDLVDAVVRLRNALNEVTTNGRWTEGEQRGEWAISKEVYETVRDELDNSTAGHQA